MAGMKRIAIDSMIVDKIMDTPDFLATLQRAGAEGHLIIVGSHVVRNQLEATRDTDRRSRLLATYDALPLQTVATRGFILGISALGGARLVDGSESGVSVDEAKTRGPGALHDALIATTASGEADVLVTEEADLTKKVKASRARCGVWSFGEFETFARSLI